MRHLPQIQRTHDLRYSAKRALSFHYTNDSNQYHVCAHRCHFVEVAAQAK